MWRAACSVHITQGKKVLLMDAMGAHGLDLSFVEYVCACACVYVLVCASVRVCVLAHVHVCIVACLHTAQYSTCKYACVLVPRSRVCLQAMHGYVCLFICVSMFACVRVCVHVCMRAYVLGCACVRVRVCACARVRECASAHVRVCRSSRRCASGRVHVFVHAHVHVCVHAHNVHACIRYVCIMDPIWDKSVEDQVTACVRCVYACV